MDEAWTFAQSTGLGISREGVELWHAKKCDAGWMTFRENAPPQPIADWRNNLRGAQAWIRTDIAKAEAAEARTKALPGRQTETAQRRAERHGSEKLDIEYS